MAMIQSISIDSDADAAYIRLRGNPVTRTDAVGEGIVVDYGADGQPVGAEVLSLGRRVGGGDAHSYLRGLVEGLFALGREAAE